MYAECTRPEPSPMPAADERHPLRYAVAFDDADTAVIRLAGDLDGAGALALGEALAACAMVGIEHFEIDATQVSFADSHGVRRLAHHAADVRQRGGRLRVTGSSRALQRVLELTGLATALTH